MRRTRVLTATLLTLLLLGTVFVGIALAVSYYDVAGEFMCNCGCNSVLKSCETMECSNREKMKTVIGGLIEEGNSKAEIVTILRAEYTDEILSAPPKEGVNLFAYITPYALVLIGLGAVAMVVRTWVARQQERYALVGGGDEKATAKPVPKKYSDKMSKELDDFGGF